jgi:hypothetical protein
MTSARSRVLAAAGALAVLVAILVIGSFQGPATTATGSAPPPSSTASMPSPTDARPHATLLEPSEPLTEDHPCASPPVLATTSPGRFELRIGRCYSDFPSDVVVIDETGLVSGIQDPLPDENRPPYGLAAVDASSRVLDYTWSAGACDRVTTVQLSRTEAGFALTREVTAKSDSCAAVGLIWRIRIFTSEPVDPAAVAIPSIEP